MTNSPTKRAMKPAEKVAVAAALVLYAGVKTVLQETIYADLHEPRFAHHLVLAAMSAAVAFALFLAWHQRWRKREAARVASLHRDLSAAEHAASLRLSITAADVGAVVGFVVALVLILEAPGWLFGYTLGDAARIGVVLVLLVGLGIAERMYRRRKAGRA